MTQEEKYLLLKDLCARIPYGVMLCEDYYEHKRTLSILDCGVYFIIDHTDKVKPYLRPMSSMTKEEKEELRLEHEKDERLFLECINKSKQGDNSMRGKVITHFASDWCNKNHFDYRGLIPMGLALEAPEGMYKS